MCRLSIRLHNEMSLCTSLPTAPRRECCFRPHKPLTYILWSSPMLGLPCLDGRYPFHRTFSPSPYKVNSSRLAFPKYQMLSWKIIDNTDPTHTLRSQTSKKRMSLRNATTHHPWPSRAYQCCPCRPQPIFAPPAFSNFCCSPYQNSLGSINSYFQDL